MGAPKDLERELWVLAQEGTCLVEFSGLDDRARMTELLLDMVESGKVVVGPYTPTTASARPA